MQKKRNRRLSGTKRFIAGLLSLVMIVSYMPTIGAMAAELPEGSEAAAEDTAIVSTTGDVDEVTTPGAEDADVPAEGASDDAADDADVQESAEAGAADDAAAAEDVVVEDKGDAAEMLGDGATPKFFFALESASNIEADNMTLEYIFKDEEGESVGTEVITINPNQTKNVYHGETAVNVENAAAIPNGAKSVVIKVQTAGNTLIYDTSDTNSCSIQVLSSSSSYALEKDYELSESDLNAIMDAGPSGNGYTLSLSDDVVGKNVILKVYIKVVKGNNGGGGDDPAPVDGQYKVYIQKGKAFPDDKTPTVNVKFFNDDDPTPIAIEEGENEVTQNWTAFPSNGSDSMTVSIPAGLKKYLQSGFIEVFEDGAHVTGHDKSIDLYDYFKSLGTLEDGNAWSYTFDISDEESYQFNFVFSYTRSLSWSYRQEDKDRDNYVENCKIFLLDADGNNRDYVDEAYNEDDPHYHSGDFDEAGNPRGYANYQLEIGKDYKFKVVPDYGYQVTGLTFNAYTIAASTEPGEVGVFDFTMSDSNFHLNGVVEKIGNTIASVDAEDVGYMTLNGTNVGDVDYADDLGAEYDPNMGGSFMITVEDEDLSTKHKDADNYADDSEATADVKAMTAVETISIDISQAVSKGTNQGYWTDAITEFDKDKNGKADPVTIAFNYPGVEGATYKIAREHGDKINIIDATYENGKLEFETDGFSEFTILKNSDGTDNVVFDLSPIGEKPGYRFTPAEGLIAVYGQENKYTYKGTGPIKVIVEETTDGTNYHPIDPDKLEEMGQGELRRLGVLYKTYEADQAPWWWAVEYDDKETPEDKDDDVTISTFPVVIQDEAEGTIYPIQRMLKSADEHKPTGEGTVGTISVGDFEMRTQMPMKQVEIKDPKGVTFDFDVKDDDNNPISNVFKSEEKGADNKDVVYYYMAEEDNCYRAEIWDEDIEQMVTEAPSIRFKVTVPDGTRLDSISYRINDAHPKSDEDPTIVLNYPAEYPTGIIYPDDAEGGVFKIPYYLAGDWDNWSRFGITMTPNVTKLTKVTVNLGANSSAYFNNDATVGAFDITARVGAKSYDLTYSVGSEDTKDARFVTYVPDGSDVVIGIKSTDGYNTLSKVSLFDAANSGKEISPVKTGEYTLKTTGKDSVTLGATVAPVTFLKVTNSSDEEYGSYKNKYNLVHYDVFKAYLVSGSKVSEGVLKPVTVTDGVTFKNGNDAISAGEGVTIDGGILSATGDALKLAGKSLNLKAAYDNNTYATTIAFSAPITSVELKEADKDGKVSVPYNTSKYLNLKIDKGANQYTVDARLVTVTDGNVIPGEEINFGSCNGKEIHVYDLGVLDNYEPDGKATFAFFVNGELKSSVYEITFTDELKDKDAPTVKANDKFSTNQAIGLSLSLPKKVKATQSMFYEITAETDLGKECTKTIDGVTYTWHDGIEYLEEPEDGDPEVVKVFKQSVTAYVPVQNKNYTLKVTDEPRDKENGWRKDYNVTVSVVYFDGYNRRTKGPGTKTTDPAITAHTKDNLYETKLGLTKKAPKKIYVGQSVDIAAVKYSAATTVRIIDRVELYDSYGEPRGNWNRWNDPNNIKEDKPMNWHLKVDDDSIIWLDTVQERRIPDGEGGYEDAEPDYLAPGKYKVVVYAVGGSAVSATATMDINIVDSIKDIWISAPDMVYKPAGKKASFKAKVSQYDGYFGVGTPDSKKVEWSLYDVPEYLKGKISINKKGTVTIDAKAVIGNENTFTIRATAADYRGNWAYSDHPVTITTSTAAPAKIVFGFWDEGQDRYVGYSPITEENIKAKYKFYSNDIKWANTLVYDELGNDITDKVTFKGKGVTINEYGQIREVKPGNVSITVTMADGSKEAKTLKFKIDNANECYKMNVLIQDNTCSTEGGYDTSFINVTETDDPLHRQGLTDEDAKDKDPAFTGFLNTCTSVNPIYVYVAGVRCGDYHWDDEQKKDVLNKWDNPDYHDTCMISSTVKVTGGKIVMTDYEGDDNYVQYAVMPTGPKTVIKVTDKTKGRTKATYTYTVINSEVAAAKAYKIKADKKTIYNALDFVSTEMEDAKNPNKVTFTVDKAADIKPGTGEKAAVRITMVRNDIWDNYAFSKALGINGEYIEDPETPEDFKHNKDIDMLQLNGRVMELADGGKFTIDFYEILDHENRGDVNDVSVVHFDRMPAGTYTFYATVGTVKEGNFTPKAAATKINVKAVNPPAAKAAWSNTKYEITDVDGAEFAVPTVTNGTGIRNWMRNEGGVFVGDAYFTKSVNTKGYTGAFERLFYVENPVVETEAEAKTKTVLAATDKINIKPCSAANGWIDDQWIAVGKDKAVCANSWYALKMLSEGTFKQNNDGYYDPNGTQVGTAKEQKKAYASWVKQNLTGYVCYRTVGLNGLETEYNQKITVDLADFIMGAEDPNSIPSP